MVSYIFSGKSLISRQLQSISRTFDAVTERRLAALGIRTGWHCLEVGAGNGSVARTMADLAGPEGSVVATDISLTELTSDRPNLVVREHDITSSEPIPEAPYDLVHLRLVLMHVPQRQLVLERLLRALKPGGWLVAEDYDVQPVPKAVAVPDGRAEELHHKVTTGLARVTASAGLDNGWGSRAYAAFRAAGFVNVAAESYSRASTAGEPGHDLVAVYIQQLREPLLAGGHLTEEELDRFLTLTEDVGFAQFTPPLISTWGRRPLDR